MEVGCEDDLSDVPDPTQDESSITGKFNLDS